MTNLLKVSESDNKMRLDIVAARMFPDFSRTQLKKMDSPGESIGKWGDMCP